MNTTNKQNITIDMRKSLYEIGNRTNINHYVIDVDTDIKKDIFIYDDHRTLLNVIFQSRIAGLCDKSPDLIYFDQHDDAAKTLDKESILQIFKVNDVSDITPEQFLGFVEFTLGGNDDDWLTAGLELDLINNVLNIGQTKNNNLHKWKGLYKGHRAYSVSFQEFSFEDSGVLSFDGSKDIRIQTIRQVLRLINRTKTPYILDFDLDCFTKDEGGITRAWTEEEFEDIFSTPCMEGHMQNLIKGSLYITICREPECCGGIRESNKILQLLDSYLFDSQINA